MTEAEWLSGTDPQAMLESLRAPGRARERKLILFGCACARRVWPLLGGGRGTGLVEVAERYADGAAAREEISAALALPRYLTGGALVHELALADPAGAVRWAVQAVADAVYRHNAERLSERRATLAVRAELRAQCHLLRDVFGNPYRPVVIDPTWLRWNHGTVPAVALHIYEDRAFHDLPILADALEDAGCADNVLLDHCRSGGEHVRGCWVLDLMLGKA
jgi:hypothetical protein